MAVYTTGMMLKDAAFPLMSKLSGRPVIIKNLDVDSIDAKAPVAAKTDYFETVNKPVALYCENVLPKNGGYQSVGYVTLMNSILPVKTAQRVYSTQVHDFATGLNSQDIVITFGTDITAHTSYIEYMMNGLHAILALPVGYANPTYISLIELDGGAYFLFSDGATTQLYDFATTAGIPSWNLITPTGISTFDFNQCFYGCSAGNYIILAKPDGTVFWNNPNINTDFAPSLTTGAGTVVPATMNGQITGLQSWVDGYVIHTTKGTLLARYSQNAQSPWQFSAIYGSVPVVRSRITNKLAVTVARDEITHYAYTTSGIMSFNMVQGYTGLYPEVSDFFAGEIYEMLVNGSPVVTSPSPTDTVEQVDVMVTRIGSRYIVFSYGRNASVNPHFQFALIYDSHLNRWGKLRIDHIEPVYLPSTLSGVEVLMNIGFLDTNANIQMAYTNAEYNGTPFTHNGVVIFGGLSLVRGNIIGMNMIEANIGIDNPACSLAAAISPDNQNYSSFTPLTPIALGNGVGKWGCKNAATYHAFSLTGRFNITSLQFKYFKAGNR